MEMLGVFHFFIIFLLCLSLLLSYYFIILKRCFFGGLKKDTLRALADPTRREILNLLKQSSMAAGDIAEHFAISGAAISRHLSVLKDADLIRDKRDGKYIYYELNTTVLEEIMLWISGLKGEDSDDQRK